MTLFIFKQMIVNLMKILRILSIPNGHLVVVAYKGQGIGTIQRLSSFYSKMMLKELTNEAEYSVDEWRMELRKLISHCC